MYSVTFTCPKGRTNRANLNKIQVWVNVDGERSTAYLDLRVNPDEFKKAIFSNRSNHISRYCSEVRRKIDEYYTECVVKGTQVRAATLTEYVRNGFEEQHYTVFNLFDDFIDIINKRKGAEIGNSTHSKYLLAIEQFKIVVGNKPVKAVDNTDILNYKYHLKNELKLKDSTLASYLTKTKSIFVFGMRNNKLTKNPFDTIKIKKGEVNIVPLTKEELMRIANKDFGIERLNQVRRLASTPAAPVSPFLALDHTKVSLHVVPDITIGISTLPWSASVVVLAATANVTVLLVLLTEMDENPVGLEMVPIVKLVKALSPRVTEIVDVTDTAESIFPL